MRAQRRLPTSPPDSVSLGSPYGGHRICLATHHGKQRALARPFALGLEAKLEVSDCDTDSLGTFSDEVQRLDDALRARSCWCS